MPKHKTISIRELASHTERIATDIELSGAMYRVKWPGHKTLALIDQERLESLEETIDFLHQHPNWREDFAKTDADYAAGRLKTLDQFLAEHGLDASGYPIGRRRRATRSTASARVKKGGRRASRSRARAS